MLFCFVGYGASVGVEADAGEARVMGVESRQDLFQLGERTSHHVAIGQEDSLRIGVPAGWLHYEFFCLFDAEPLVRHVAVHPAERAAVVRASLVDLENQAVGLRRRPKSCICHGGSVADRTEKDRIQEERNYCSAP